MDRMVRIKNLRKRLGMKQEEVSQATGTPTKKIKYYENGGLKCPEIYEARLLKILNQREKNEVSTYIN